MSEEFIGEAQITNLKTTNLGFWRRVWVAILFVVTGEAQFGPGVLTVWGYKAAAPKAPDAP